MPEESHPLTYRVFGSSGRQVLGIFEDRSIPWVARAYLYLFLFTLISFVLIYLISTFRSEVTLAEKLTTFLGDGLKVIIGGALGSLSAASQHIFVAQTPKNVPEKNAEGKSGKEGGEPEYSLENSETEAK
jgi:hypothetical protein